MQVAAILAKKDQTQEEIQVHDSRFLKLISVLKQARHLDQQAEALDEKFQLMDEELTDTILTSDEGSKDMLDYLTSMTDVMQQQHQLVNN